MDDMAILRAAYHRENDSRDRRHPGFRNWEYYTIGANPKDIRRLVDEGMLVVAVKTSLLTKYKLSDKGRGFVAADLVEREEQIVPADDILQAMNLVVGFDDVKLTLARAVERRRRINFLLEGPPACAKSLMLEGIRSVVKDSYICFGSRTSASGLSDILFERQPKVLLMDEADKMHADVFSVLLGLMESGEVLETKSKKTRGVQLECIVVAACNSSEKMPPEFLSRFALHVNFPLYTREEFIDVCRGFLFRAENCPEDMSEYIGQKVYDYGLGDVRKARGVWQLMTETTTEEADRVIRMMMKYAPGTRRRKKQNTDNKLF